MAVLDFADMITQFLQGAWNQLVRDNRTAQFCSANREPLLGIMNQDMNVVLPLLFDSGFLENSGPKLQEIVEKIAFGTVGIEMDKARLQAPRELTYHAGDLNGIVTEARKFIMNNNNNNRGNFNGSGNYNSNFNAGMGNRNMPATSVYGNNNNNFGNGNFNGSNNAISNGAGAFVAGGSNRSSGVGNFGPNGQSTTVSSFTEGQEMQKSDHLPHHLRKPEMQPTLNQNIQQPEIQPAQVDPVVETKPKRKVYTTNVEILNNLENKFRNDVASISSTVYMSIPESISKPILLTIQETKFFPILNPTEEVTRNIIDIVQCAKDIFELFEKLDILAKRNQIAPAIEWINKRISHCVEMALRHRFRIPMASMPNYRKYHKEFHATMSECQWYSELQDLIMVYIKDEFGEINITEGEHPDAPPVDFVEVTSLTQMLTVPWIIRYNYGKNLGWSEEICDGELNLVLAKAFAMVDKNINSLLVTDISNTRFRVYPISIQAGEEDNGPQFHWEIFAF